MQRTPRPWQFRRSSGAAGPEQVDVRPHRAARVSVIIPALNEALNLPHVLSGLPPVDEVILVDGGSLDDTVAVARRLHPGIRVVTQNRRGKGNALACGFAAATGDIIVMIDADGSTDPAEIPRFLRALYGGADFAKGSRFAPDGGSADITPVRRLGNHGLNWMVNVMFGTRYSDLCYGYNAFWSDCLRVFALDTAAPRPAGGGKLWGDGFEIETLLNLRAARAGLRVVEVPSFEHSRIHGTTNLATVRDGLRVLRTIVREWPRRRPAPPVPPPPPPAAIGSEPGGPDQAAEPPAGYRAAVSK